MQRDPLREEAGRYFIGVLVILAICLVLVAIAFLTSKKGESEQPLPAPAPGSTVSRSVVFITPVA